MSDLIGQVVSRRYRVDSFIGKGGMAEVYKVWDLVRSVNLAMKVLHPDLAEDKVFIRRFRREAETLAKLQHPNIVRFYGLERDGDLVYILMDYVEGTTLRKEIFRAEEPFSQQRVFEIMAPVCAALNYAHQSGFVHCDVKPANIMLHKNGTVLLSDFGIARLTEAVTVTMVGAGTPAYMAPEQARGEDPSPRTDIYALGVVLFEMLTGGERPFTGERADTTGSTSEKIRWEQMRLSPPSLIQFNPNIDTEMEKIVLRCLEKDQLKRFSNTAELLSSIQKFLNVTIENEEQAGRKTESLVPPVPEPEGDSEQKQSIPYIKTSQTIRNFWLWGVGVLVAIVLFVGAGIQYFMNQDRLQATATAQTFQLQRVATEQAQFVFATATEGALHIQATATEGALHIQATVTEAALNMQATATKQAHSVPTTSVPTKISIPTQTSFPAEIKDSKGVLMAFVPPGEFIMGSDNSDDLESRPSHTVYVDAFYIDKYEVTNELYAACVDADVCRRPRQPGSITRSTYYSNPFFANYPVLYLDWWMAKAYCTWRGARLPTEAEWEKAARGTDGRVYPWESQERSCFYSNLSGCEDDTTAVDKYNQGQSPYGVYDMSGNVWEWTNSLFQPYPYNSEDGREDPTAAGERVTRSGSWHSFGVQTGSALVFTRFGLDPSYYGAYVGVRCARDTTP